MPTLTPTQDAFSDPDFLNIIGNPSGFTAESLELKLGERILRSFEAGKEVHVHCAFAGTGNNEMSLLAAGHRAHVTFSDASDAAVEFLRGAVAGRGSRVAVTRLSFPFGEPPEDADAFHAVTCLGISLFHVEGRDGRLACLKDFYRMLRPGGHLFVDNKGWDAQLREERDPITIYPLPDGRLLAATYEYPRVGEQVSHLQLMETGTRPGGRLHVVKRWTIRAFPVSTATLERELVEAGFEPAQVFDETLWPDDLSDGRGAYYQLLVARRPRA